MRRLYYEVLLPVLLDACSSADPVRHHPGSRQDDGDDVRFPDLTVSVPHRMDLGRDVSKAQSGSAYDGISDFMACRRHSNPAIWMERKMDAENTQKRLSIKPPYCSKSPFNIILL